VEATYKSSINERTVGGEKWLRKCTTMLGFLRNLLVGISHLCSRRLRSCRILPLPGFQSRTVQSVPSHNSDYAANGRGKICRKIRRLPQGLWKRKETDPKYRYHYIKWGWVRSKSLPPPIRKGSTFKPGTYRITYITATANLLPQVTLRSLGITFLSPLSCLRGSKIRNLIKT